MSTAVVCAASTTAPILVRKARRGNAGPPFRGPSPLIDRALDLRASAGLNVGRRDYFGNPIPAGGGFHPGAHECRSGDTCRAREELRALAREFAELRAEDDAAKTSRRLAARWLSRVSRPGRRERRVAAVWAEWSAHGLGRAPEPATR